MIFKKRVWLFLGLALIVAVVLAFVGCQKSEQKSLLSEKEPAGQVVKAYYAKGSPGLDGKGDDSFWRKVSATVISTSGEQKVKLKAAYTDDKIYFLASWPGVGESGALKMWEYDGAAWTTPLGCYPTIGFLWSVDSSIKGFEKEGCQLVCHKPTQDRNTWSMGIPAEKAKGAQNQRGDLWDISVSYAKVTGLANDFYLGVDPLLQKYYGSSKDVDIVLRPDSFEDRGPFDINGTEKPIYMLKEGLSVMQVPYPSYEQLASITDYAIFKQGDRVPYFILNQQKMADGKIYGGSRDDVRAKGTWANGSWTVELERKLRTGNKDDITFSSKSKKPYLFAIALKGRSVRDFKEMFISEPLTLRFEPPK